jgi:hypothetical protein
MQRDKGETRGCRVGRFSVGEWSVERMRHPSGAWSLGWDHLNFWPSALQVLILPLLARLRFFVTPVDFTVSEYPSGKSAVVRTADFPNGRLMAAMRGLRGEEPAVAGFGPTEASKCIFAIAFAMAQAHRIGNHRLAISADAVLLDSRLEPAIAAFVGLYHRDYNGPYLLCVDALCVPPEAKDESEEPEGGLVHAQGSAYSFGMALFRWFGGNTGKKRLPIALRAIARGERFSRPPSIPDGYWELVQECWRQKPTERPTLEAIVERLIASPDFTVPGTDAAAYAAYRSGLIADSLDADLAVAVEGALARYAAAHPE